MKRATSFYSGTGMILLLSLATWFACSSLNLSAQGIDKEIIGTWILESNGDQLSGGEITFNDKGKYQFQKKFSDGQGASESGCYRLDVRYTPANLLLCLGDCNAAGAEFTTSYCLARISKDGKLEIIISSEGNFPPKFPRDKMSKGYYTFVRSE
ncbi:MAG: hypothetical protein ACOYXB_03845 [Bacteroidota bacterium]